MNKLNYTEEIFNILSRGGFISNNSVQTKIKRYYGRTSKNLCL